MDRGEPKLGQSNRRATCWLEHDGSIALVLALAISAVLLGMRPSITLGQDYQLMHQFYKLYLRTSIRAGELPLWNPYVALGRPFLADPETAVFYPPNWIFIIFPEKCALFLFLAFHFWLAGCFFLKLARRWSAPREAAVGLAFAYLLSGAFLGRLQLGLLGYFCGLAYWPALFYIVERLREKRTVRDWIRLTLALSGGFLCGHPQCFWLTTVALGLYLAGAHLGPPWRENTRRGLSCLGLLAGAYVFALLLCAVQLLPTVDLMVQGNRPAPNLQFSSAVSLNWEQYTTLYLFSPQVAARLETNLYIGAIGAFMGLLGLSQWRDARVRGLLLMGAFGYLLGLGQRTPVFGLLFHILPGMGWFRLAERYAILLPWAMLLAALLAWTSRSFSRARVFAILCLLLGGTAYGFWLGKIHWATGLTAAVLLAISAVVAGGIRPRAWTRMGAVSRCAFIALLGLDSSMAAARAWIEYVQVAPGGYFEAEISDTLHERNLYPSNGVPPRLFVPIYLMRTNSGMKYGFSSVSGYGALTSMRVWTYLNIGAGLQMEYLQDTYLPDTAYAAGPFPFPQMNIVAGVVNGTTKFIFNPRPGARAYLAYAWDQVPDWTSALRRMVLGQVDLAKRTLLEAPATGPARSVGTAGRGKVVIDAFHRNSIELHVHSSAPALLTVAEAWYPGWRATVNGVPAEVLPANVWMRAVRVPAGESRVEMYYVEPDLAFGAAISLGALLTLLLIVWRLGQKPFAGIKISPEAPSVVAPSMGSA